jgi:hypothetical protein
LNRSDDGHRQSNGQIDFFAGGWFHHANAPRSVDADGVANVLLQLTLL